MTACDGGSAALAAHAPRRDGLHAAALAPNPRWPRPHRFIMATAPALIAKNKLWADYCDGKVPLNAAIRKFVKSIALAQEKG